MPDCFGDEGAGQRIGLTFMAESATPNYENRIHSEILKINALSARSFTLIGANLGLRLPRLAANSRSGSFEHPDDLLQLEA
jgi:hypothetical protein